MATADDGWRNVHERLDALLAWASPEYAGAENYLATVKATPAAGAALASKLGRPSVAASIAAVAKGLAEKPFCSGIHLSLADIAAGCALGYLDFRFPQIGWRTEYPNLTKLQDKLMLRASFADTGPV